MKEDYDYKKKMAREKLVEAHTKLALLKQKSNKDTTIAKSELKNARGEYTKVVMEEREMNKRK